MYGRAVSWQSPDMPSGAPSGMNKGPTIALAVSASPAAYQAAEIARILVRAGARVIPLMTRDAHTYLGPATLGAITGEAVRTEVFEPGFAGEAHLAVARDADVVLIAPASADMLARLASGRADGPVTALALATERPVLAAPAMSSIAWAHPAVQGNVAILRAQGRVELIGPAESDGASGELGMLPPSLIAAAALSRAGRRDLQDFALVVTAGPTIEDLDPVRFIGNRSTGKMGFAIAERAAARGAGVTLIAGPVHLPTPHGVYRVDVRSALAMQTALWQALGPDLGRADALVMTAAVADYRPAEVHAAKMKRSDARLSLELVPNPDLLAEVGRARQNPQSGRSLPSPVLVGFAVETGDDDQILAYARGKLAAKRVDMVVANNARDAFGTDDNRATLVEHDRVEPLGVLSKMDLADRILDRVAALCDR
jgi:phosphopantothenoylcysteine decarboxylase/phosphopantothenate--cysteine ligase